MIMTTNAATCSTVTRTTTVVRLGLTLLSSWPGETRACDHFVQLHGAICVTCRHASARAARIRSENHAVQVSASPAVAMPGEHARFAEQAAGNSKST